MNLRDYESLIIDIKLQESDAQTMTSKNIKVRVGEESNALNIPRNISDSLKKHLILPSSFEALQ